MQIHPVLFALLAYAVAAVIAACVTVIVRIIAFAVQRKKGATDGAKTKS